KLTDYSIGIERDYDLALPNICAYGSELNQVWTNLLDNAIDALVNSQQTTTQPEEIFTPTNDAVLMSADPQITLRTCQKKDYVQVEIIDNGPGIPKQLRSRIFEPFFTTKDVGAGTGLGLDIVHRIVVKRHGGSIRVTSQPGETNFQVCLPVRPPIAPGG
ncbi:MAG: ATP-binding protein, partial [Cyanobacteria bacterium P01_F01_bin.53]